MRALALEESGPPATVDTRVVFKLGQWLRYIDDLDGARARLEHAEQQAREEGDESSLANILLNRVIVATWAGDLAGAAELAERMLDAFGQHGGRCRRPETSGARTWTRMPGGSSPSAKPPRRQIRGSRW